MDNIILSHIENDEKDFKTYVQLANLTLSPDFFTKKSVSIYFFDKIVLGSGIIINGKYEGFWIHWDIDDWRHEGSYQNGEHEGFWIFWNGNDRKINAGSYSKGTKEGFWTFWWKNGKKKSQGSYIHGRKNNDWVYWWENGEKTW